MYYDTQSAPRPDNGGKTKVWKIIALVLLLLCALPVLIPAALCVGGGVLVMALCVAGAALAAVPIITIFLMFQKYFTKGITMGAVKG